MSDFLKQHTFELALAPVLLYIIYIGYSFIRDFQTGIANLLIAIFGLPLTIINQLFLFYILRLFFNKDSSVHAIVLSLVAISSLLTVIHRMMNFVKIQNVNITSVTTTASVKGDSVKTNSIKIDNIKK